VDSNIILQIRSRADVTAGVSLSPEWMATLPIAPLGGKRAIDLIADGDGEAVLVWLASLEAGSFS
jgi:hypothetical protein